MHPVGEWGDSANSGRMGQTQEVTVHRFVVEESVEERMVNKIQARKKFIASSLGMMSDEEKKQVSCFSSCERGGYGGLTMGIATH
jgi:SNF2 family DNA or RNA helicase